MLNRLTSAVQGAVSAGVTNAVHVVQGVLVDEITKSYELPKECSASGGHGLLWKIYPGISKKTSMEVSIFIFDKDDIRKLSKDKQEKILNIMRLDMKTLRTLRHPQVLKVEEVFEETKRLIAFVTEKVTCSLANAFKIFNNISNVTPDILEIGLSDFEIACGLMNLGNALVFLHREGRRVHLSIGPQSIFITTKGDWKLGGFGFSRVIDAGQSSRSEYYLTDNSSTTIQAGKSGPSIIIRTDPPLEYCAPELVTEPRNFKSSADMFSLGLLAYELFSATNADGTRTPILSNGQDTSNDNSNNIMSYNYKVQSLHPIQFTSSVPVSIQNTLRSLLKINPDERLEPQPFLSSPFFDSGPVKTLKSLQNLVELDPASQAKFLTSLTPLLQEFSPRVLRDMVIPGLQAVIINKQVAPFAILPILKIVEILDKLTFSRYIGPMMIPLLALTEPIQCMLMLATNLHVLIPKVEDVYMKNYVVPMLCRALDSNVPEILDTVLNKIVDHANLFEYRILKQVILPRVIKLILDPPQISVRVNALIWLAKSYHVFDKDLLIEQVLPTLTDVLKSDKTPAVCMCILGCFDNLSKHLGPEHTAKSVLPAVVPLLWERTLNEKQLDIVCERIQDMIKHIISEREKIFAVESSVQSASDQLDTSVGIFKAVKAIETNNNIQSGMDAASNLFLDQKKNNITTNTSGGSLNENTNQTTNINRPVVAEDVDYVSTNENNTISRRQAKKIAKLKKLKNSNQLQNHTNLLETNHSNSIPSTYHSNVTNINRTPSMSEYPTALSSSNTNYNVNMNNNFNLNTNNLNTNNLNTNNTSHFIQNPNNFINNNNSLPISNRNMAYPQMQQRQDTISYSNNNNINNNINNLYSGMTINPRPSNFNLNNQQGFPIQQNIMGNNTNSNLLDTRSTLSYPNSLNQNINAGPGQYLQLQGPNGSANNNHLNDPFAGL